MTLWAYTAEHVPAKPLLGIGGSSTRKIDQSPANRQMQWRKKRKTEGFGWHAGTHAHNAFLQTWYELGAVGVILFVATGSAVILSLYRLPRGTQRFALAQVAALFAIGAFAWGMWQGWLMALTGLAALYVSLAVNVHRAGQAEMASTAPGIRQGVIRPTLFSRDACQVVAHFRAFSGPYGEYAERTRKATT
ncbi:hypothetical protein AUC68_02345 [Methyloceanibacter methanicus]|uniref:O-antigen ligase-related domain-containing protein n=1 Tax=Methyloceanibacter methanicus TaxID=1774968 RepID=A0A1E3W2C2_9HYPH|nr:O-antigen ligase family protein [Methyloceanibacter methanicus]ODR99968.1 hypothetical protein AUC68_02345 [Methyloceanibacter methanicus]